MPYEDKLTSSSTAAKPPIVEHFSITGLYGYRTVSLDSKSAATVVIAANGSGKTTLLGALDAFLRGQFLRLSDLDFSSLRCKLRGTEELKVEKEDIALLATIPTRAQFGEWAKFWDMEPNALLEFLQHDLPLLDGPNADESPVFEAIVAKAGYDRKKAKAQCAPLVAALVKSPKIDEVREKVRIALADVEVVYLPTYRRVELSLPQSVGTDRFYRKRQSIQVRLGISKTGLHSGDIQFGLADISERLGVLHRQILRDSNRGYGQISANIINDLITGAFASKVPRLEERPSKEALHLFFSRIQEEEYGPYSSRRPFVYTQIPDVDRIYAADDVTKDTDKFLTYFLGKLNSVMQKTKDVEEMVKEFIRNCNRYLSSESAEADAHQRLLDDKELTFDRKTLQVSVKSRISEKMIALEALSSGEKQMISLFARLYLYPPKKKLVLIDEPELSLSLEWQKTILVDVVNAPSCAQVIAITHSPFVFDNELEPYATSLQLTLSRPTGDPFSNWGDVEEKGESYE